MAVQKYYVVWQGKIPGIYTSWAEAERQIKGFPAAKFKSFKSKQEAEAAYKNPNSIRTSSKPKKPMYYVVWRGLSPGIYTNWETAKAQLAAGTKPLYKTFGSKMLADKAFAEGPENYMGRGFKKTRDLTEAERIRIGDPIELSLCVDAACNGKKALYEYRGVWNYNNEEAFKVGPHKEGTNNIGEFLALVHALAFLKKMGLQDFPIYSDSRIAMGWVKQKRIKTSSKDPQTQDLLNRGLRWLHNNSYNNPILKWETKAWGEIPADFGRK